MSENYSELMITVSTNVLFITLFIGLFFFTYVAYIEESVVQSQMGYLSEEILSKIKILGNDFITLFGNYVNTMGKPNLDKEDKEVEIQNSNVKYKALYANIGFSIIVIGLVYVIYNMSDKSFSISDIIIKNLIILFFIALTEFSFLTYFGSKYVSLNLNAVKYSLINNIQDLVLKL
jgi:hypothetical protein